MLRVHYLQENHDGNMPPKKRLCTSARLPLVQTGGDKTRRKAEAGQCQPGVGESQAATATPQETPRSTFRVDSRLWKRRLVQPGTSSQQHCQPGSSRPSWVVVMLTHVHKGHPHMRRFRMKKAARLCHKTKAHGGRGWTLS